MVLQKVDGNMTECGAVLRHVIGADDVPPQVAV
jgi:hypothetical protein